MICWYDFGVGGLEEYLELVVEEPVDDCFAEIGCFFAKFRLASTTALESVESEYPVLLLFDDNMV